MNWTPEESLAYLEVNGLEFNLRLGVPDLKMLILCRNSDTIEVIEQKYNLPRTGQLQFLLQNFAATYYSAKARQWFTLDQCLSIAAKNGLFEEVRSLIQVGAGHRASALNQAIQARQPQIGMFLLQELGPEIPDLHTLHRCLMQASMGGFRDLTEILFNLVHPSEIDRAGPRADEELIAGATHRQLHICELFLERGARSWNPAMAKAALIGDLEIIQLLWRHALQHEPRLPIRIEGLNRSLNVAVAKGHLAVVQFLLAEGATVRGSALNLAIRFDHRTVVELITAIPLGVNAIASALEQTAVYGRVELAEYLLAILDRDQLGPPIKSWLSIFKAILLDTRIPIYDRMMEYARNHEIQLSMNQIAEMALLHSRAVAMWRHLWATSPTPIQLPITILQSALHRATEYYDVDLVAYILSLSADLDWRRCLSAALGRSTPTVADELLTYGLREGSGEIIVALKAALAAHRSGCRPFWYIEELYAHLQTRWIDPYLQDIF